MPPARRRLAVVFVALIVSGCGSAEPKTGSEGTQERVEISIVEPETELDGPLPSGMCFVATRDLETVITVHEGAPPGLCERLAGYLPAGAGRAAWPPEFHGDEALNAGCAFRSEGARIEVSDLPDRGDGRLDALDVCDAMIADGWELQPLLDPSLLGELGEEAAAGTCYVAIARYEVELGAATNRGQALCEQLAEKHLPVPVAHRAPPVATDPQYLGYGNVACEATRAGDRVQVMHLTAERGTHEAEGVCDSLERDGWKVAHWG
jgi:hypothetical protein